jgi:hypothetical protein
MNEKELSMGTKENQIKIDILTLVAISTLAWILVDILHEIVGHAGAAVLLGIPVRAVSTTTAYLDWDKIQSVREARIILAGGTLVNLITGGLALLILHSRKGLTAAWQYFLWLFATFSFIITSLNLVTAPLMGGGDWAEFIRELDPWDLWHNGLIGVGLLVAVAGYILPLRMWIPNLKGNRRVQLKVTLIPVVTLIAVQTLSLVNSPFAKLPPASNHLLVSAFAYFHFILWALIVNILPVPRAPKTVESIGLQPTIGWLAVGLVVFLFFVVVLGPGLGPLENDPRLMW